MAITRIFIHREWDQTGTRGLKPTWFEGADPTRGRGVAHDMLEHFKRDPGPLEGECMALGSFLLLRLNNGFGSNSLASISPLGNDVLGLLYAIAEKGYDVPRLVKTRPLEEHFEQEVQKAFTQGYGSLEDALENLDEGVRGAYRERILAAREPMMSFVRTGFRKALRRYNGCDLYAVGVNLFGKVEKMIDKLLGSETLWEGAKVRVSIDARRLMAWIHVYDPDTGRWLDDEHFC